MCDIMSNSLYSQVKSIRKYLKIKLLEDNIRFRNHPKEREHVYDLIKRCVVHGESHSALIIGPRGCGKTTLINSVLHQLCSETDVSSDAIIVKLNGLIHHDDKVALKSITAQMQLENAVGDRVFGTFAENLTFLLSCLASADRRCKSTVFILEECDMFCHSGRAQTLLYNLFDITHTRQAPVCALGVTNRLDVMELLEKRVKSRFSHRHIFLFPNEADTPPVERHSELMVQLLSLPLRSGGRESKRKGRRKSTVNIEDMDIDPDQTIQYAVPNTILSRCKVTLEVDGTFVQDWNAHVTGFVQSEPVQLALEKLCYYTSSEQTCRDVLTWTLDIDPDQTIQYAVHNTILSRCKATLEVDGTLIQDWNAHVSGFVQSEPVKLALEKLCYYTSSEQTCRDVLFQLVSRLSSDKPYLDTGDFTSIIDNTVAPEHRVKMLQSLSILELSLVIAMMHGMEIFDGQPMNFEMVLHRYTKFANANSSTQSVPRPVILKAFEHLQALEIILPVRTTDSIYTTSDTTASRVQKEYKLYTLAVPLEDIKEAVKGFKALPTEINHWFNNSVVS